jgi:trehalose 6-phosphate synthase
VNWQPVVLKTNSDHSGALTLMAMADVLVVNPLWDGMNLLAKEGAAVSERDAVLILSRNAGAADELGADALLVNPFDVSELAGAMEAALDMDVAERRRRAQRMRAAATAAPPADWFARVLGDLGRLAPGS